jgi:hypothetical protein
VGGGDAGMTVTTRGKMVKLAKCEACDKFVDNYVELEPGLVLLDMVLQRASVYRHLLSNRRIVWTSMLKWIPLFLFLDVYLEWLRLNHPTELPSRFSPQVSLYVQDVLLLAGVAILELITFSSVLILLVHTFCAREVRSAVSATDIISAIAVSSYGKFLLMMMFVWSYPLVFSRVIEGFILISNVTAIQALLSIRTWKVTLLVGVAYAIRLVVAYTAEHHVLHSYFISPI